MKFNRIAKKAFYATEKNTVITVIITGIGRSSFPENISPEGACDLVLKAGACAVLDPDLETGMTYVPSFVGHNGHKNTVDMSSLDDSVTSHFAGYVIGKGLMTVDEPVMSSGKAAELVQSGYCLADMETYFLMGAFKGAPFIPVMAGTDRGDENAEADFKKNIGTASEILSKFIINSVRALAG